VVDVVLVQHAEKERGPDDPGLTAEGLAQAADVAAALRDYRPDRLYSSPLRRARQTAERVAEATGTAVEVEPALQERMNWTRGCGLSLQAFVDEWTIATADRDYVPKVGESSRTAGDRLHRWLLWLPRHIDRVIAVTHGGVTVDLLRTVLGDDELQARAPALLDGVPCGALTYLGLTGGSLEVQQIADTTHLTSHLVSR
jgi:broad specificity phosphatase PhoE